MGIVEERRAAGALCMVLAYTHVALSCTGHNSVWSRLGPTECREHRRVGPLTEQDVKLRAGRGWGNRAPTDQKKLFFQAAGLLTTTNSGSTSFFGTQHRSTLLSLHFDVRRWSKNHP